MIIDDLSTPGFSKITFDLLVDIAKNPNAAFYLAHKKDFQRYVERPLQAIMVREAQLLPGMMRERLETRHNIFSRFLKNDFGRGGAWTNYWGAFYPKGSRRIADVQLALWIDRNFVGISFYIGDYAPQVRKRFERNCNQLDGRESFLSWLIHDDRFIRAKNGQTKISENGRLAAEEQLTWEEWLTEPSSGNYWVFQALTPEEACELSGESLASRAAEHHTALFPLALLAMENNPTPILRIYETIIGPWKPEL